MAIYDFFLSRNNGPTITDYVGHAGRLFYDSSSGGLRISDGTTAGGLPMPLTVATTSIVGGIKPAAGFTVSPDGTLSLNAGNMFELTEANVFVLKAATETQIGGVKLGPGVTTNESGQIIIDPEGLEFSFGDFASTIGTHTDETDYAVLQTINANEDAVIASNGTGSVCIVGELHVHPTNGNLTDTLESQAAFIVKADGQVSMYVNQQDAQLGAVEIVGSSTGDVVAPGIDGTMLHITGQREDPCRVYIDGNGDYVSLVARRWNGNFTDGRTAVLANDYVLRINATAQTDAGMGSVAMAQISIQALENQTTTAQGSKIIFTATPVGSAASARVDVANITVANGVSATKFTGPLTGNVTGDVSGNAGTVTNGVYTTGDQTIGGAKTFSTQVTALRVVDTSIRTINGGTTCTIDFATDSIILWTAPTATSTITLQNYTAGATVKLIIALTTSRDINYGVIDNAHSSTGSDDWNGSGAGSVDISNTAMHLTYTCVTDVASGCYVQVVAN